MNISKQYKNILQLVLCTLLGSSSIFSSAAEHHLTGLLDVRLSITDSFDSYLEGGYGKFRDSQGTNLSLSISL